MTSSKHLVLLSLLLLPCLLAAQNVGIGTAAPAEKLHVAGNLRVDFLAGVDTRLVTADANGSLGAVAAGAVGEVLTQTVAGPAWASASANAWNLTGNAGTGPASNFVGTTDVQPLAFRTQNIERARFTETGLLCVNGTGPFVVDRFSVYADGNETAVNGYASGTGNAGFFNSYGSGSSLVSYATGTAGTAGTFVSASPAPNGSPTLYVYNSTAQGGGISLRSDISSATAHGMRIDLNGTSSNMGLSVDMDAATSGFGIGVMQNGTGHGVVVQSMSAANNLASVYVDQNGTGRAVEAKTYLATNAVQTGYFGQGSTGLAPGTYANATAVWGQSGGIRGGAFLSGGSSASNTVVQGVYAGPAGTFDGIGMLGVFSPSAGYGYGVVGQGNFYGVFANGNLGASGAKTFLIDHPLDPGNRYLRHFSMESDEVLNVYRGTAVLDASGEATVALPSYFTAVNAEVSYQLTPIGAPADVYVSAEVDASGSFGIAGGNPGQKICWTVYADRNDPYMQQHPELLETEPLKREHQQGKYLHPELYGQPASAGMFEDNKVRPALVQPAAVPQAETLEQAVPDLTPKTRSGN